MDESDSLIVYQGLASARTAAQATSKVAVGRTTCRRHETKPPDRPSGQSNGNCEQKAGVNENPMNPS